MVRMTLQKLFFVAVMGAAFVAPIFAMQNEGAFLQGIELEDVELDHPEVKAQLDRFGRRMRNIFMQARRQQMGENGQRVTPQELGERLQAVFEEDIEADDREMLERLNELRFALGDRVDQAMENVRLPEGADDAQGVDFGVLREQLTQVGLGELVQGVLFVDSNGEWVENEVARLQRKCGKESPEGVELSREAALRLAHAKMKAQKAIHRVQSDELKRKAEERINQIREEKRDAIKKKNTVLFKTPSFTFSSGTADDDRQDPFEMPQKISLGFFKNDFYRLGLIATDCVVDYCFYKKMRQERIDYVVNRLEQDTQGLLDLLESIEYDVDLAYDVRDEDDEELGFWGRLKKRIFSSDEHPKIKALKDYLKKEHHFIGYNPFKKELLPAALTRFGVRELSGMMQRSLQSYDENFWREEDSAYVKNAKGELERLPNEFVVSTASAVGFLGSPVATASNFISSRSGESTRQALNDILGSFGCKIPNFLFSQWFLCGCRAVSFGAAIKVYDRFLRDMWIDYVYENLEELSGILREYQKVRADGTYEQINSVKEKLAEFVQAGHQKTGLFSSIRNFGSWVFTHKGTELDRKCIVGLALAAFIAWKAYRPIKNLYDGKREET